MALELSKIRFYALLVLKFYLVFIKLRENDVGHTILTKFYNLSIPQALLKYGPLIVQKLN